MVALTKAQMVEALRSLITDGRAIQDQFLKDFIPWTTLFVAWLKACEATVEAIYGTGSDALQTFKGIYFVPPPTETYANDGERDAGKLVWFYSGVDYAIANLAGYAYSIDRLLPPDTAPPRTPYNIFISHGGATTTHVDAVAEMLEAVGLSPVIVARRPSMNLSLNQKVLRYLGICAAGIALATVEDEEEAAKLGRTRPNVEHEIGLMQTAPNIADRIIYCKEEKVKFASNYAEKVWIPFAKQQAQDAFVSILRELHAFGLL